ncbi:MAG: DUF423 domain-containing protein [Gammaproteobacteria bacterium]|nr:DUF423 domain-containing protein [Gammaproteobacteria bacterium]
MSLLVFSRFATLSGFIAVALGAFGAHALKTKFSAYQLDIWQTAVFYQFVHTLLLLFVSQQTSLICSRPMLLKTICYCLVAGILLFSGSLYLLAALSIKWLGAVTPLGGLLFLMSWMLLAFAYTGKKHN